MIERQPRHSSGARRSNLSILQKVVGGDLFEVGQKIPVRDHDPGGPTGRPRRVLQVGSSGSSSKPARHCSGAVQVQRINLDDGWTGFTVLRLGVLADIADG